jgi:hypothetical protein
MISERDDKSRFTLKEKLQYAALGLVLAGGTFYFGRRIIRRANSTAEQKKAWNEGNPQDYAQRIKMAFENDSYFGWGTDEAALRKVLLEIPSEDVFQKTVNAYQKMFNRSLMGDMKDELSTTEYNEMMAIINQKPKKALKNQKPAITQAHYTAWAKRLKAAFDYTNWIFPGTDEDAVQAVFMEFPTQRALVDTGKTYKALYQRDLVYDLKDELTSGEYQDMMEILKQKPL